VARRLRRLALSESTCQGASEDFVPPAAQRKAVSRTLSFVPVAPAAEGAYHTQVRLAIVATMCAAPMFVTRATRTRH